MCNAKAQSESRRLATNLKERQRVKRMNRAFHDLKSVLPKMVNPTKVDILSSAKDYIIHLTQLLQDQYCGTKDTTKNTHCTSQGDNNNTSRKTATCQSTPGFSAQNSTPPHVKNVLLQSQGEFPTRCTTTNVLTPNIFIQESAQNVWRPTTDISQPSPELLQATNDQICDDFQDNFSYELSNSCNSTVNQREFSPLPEEFRIEDILSDISLKQENTIQGTTVVFDDVDALFEDITCITSLGFYKS